MEEEAYYVNIKEPVDTRKKILETSRQVVMSLQKYEAFKLKREKKHNLVNSLRDNFREINELILRLKKELPQVKIKKNISSEKAMPKVAAKKTAKAKRDFDDLEKELNEIEMKLKGLQ